MTDEKITVNVDDLRTLRQRVYPSVWPKSFTAIADELEAERHG